jgi:hypothetical protein
MATRYVGQVATAAGIQPQAGRNNIVAAAAGGTLAGSQVAQLVFDDAVFVGQEGKQRLLLLLESIGNFIETARSWPIDTTS